MEYEYHFLHHKKQYVNDVADSLYNYYPKAFQQLANINSKEEARVFIEEYYTKYQLPFGIVAIDPQNTKFVGFVGACLNSAYPKNKSPWITNLYVVKEYRKRGVAKKMISTAKRVLAEDLKFEEVYLWTDDRSLRTFYIKQGFIYEKSAVYEGFNMDIYKSDIYPNVSIIQPVHFTGLIVIIMLIIFFKATIRFFYRLVFDWSVKKE